MNVPSLSNIISKLMKSFTVLNRPPAPQKYLVSFTAPNFLQHYPKYVIWNFPNASSVSFSGTLWGSLYAPFATVTLNGDVRGVVVANAAVAKSGVTDWNQRPEITVDCPRPS